MNTQTLFALTLTLLSSAVGCGYTIEQHSVLDELQHVAQRSPTTTAARIDATIRVAVDPIPQGLHLTNSRENSREYTSFPVAPPPAGATEEQQQAHYRAQLDEVHETTRNYVVQHFDDAEEALMSALHRHLQSHFSGVEVQLGGDADFRVRASVRSRRALTKRAQVWLETMYGRVPMVDGHGERRTGPHLAWAIPIALISGPIGASVAGGALGRIGTAHYRSAVAQAIDDVARAWAAQLAAQWRAHYGDTDPRVATQPAAAPRVAAY